MSWEFGFGSTGVLVKPDKIANRSYLFAPSGNIAARYDKIHMFDAVLGPGESFRESKNFRAGDTAVVVDLPWGPPGLSICYDLRFPGLYRTLAKAGAAMLAIPSAFTRQTGAAHWHTMLRTRAIETGTYVLAAAQSGKHESGRETFGHSLVVSPWGDIVAECKGDIQASVILADIDCTVVADARRRMPSLEHDRPFGVVRAGPREEVERIS